MLTNILENYTRQRHQSTELLIFFHGIDELSRSELSALELLGVRHYTAAASETLGSILNKGFALARGSTIIKWDDDDFYGSFFVDEAEFFLSKESTLVGKGSWFCWMEELDKLFIRFPDGAHREAQTLAGGTLAVHKSLLSSVEFPHQNLGEDQGFIKKAREAGVKPYSCSALNYVQVRRADKDSHAWAVSASEYLSKSVFLSDARDFSICDSGDFASWGIGGYARMFQPYRRPLSIGDFL